MHSCARNNAYDRKRDRQTDLQTEIERQNNRQDRQQAKALVVHFRDQLNVYLREELQIFEGTAGESTNIYIFQI